MSDSLLVKTDRNDAKVIIKDLVKALLPVQIFSCMTGSLSVIINSFIVGSALPAEALIALGFVSPLGILTNALSGLISGGARILCGKYIGKGEKENVNKVFGVVTVMLLVIGGIMSIAGIALSVPIATVLGARDEMIEITALYLRGYSIGFIPTLFTPTLMVFLQMNNKSRASLIGTIILAVLNLGLGVFNVKSLGGDIFFMGLVAPISQITVMVILFIWLLTGKSAMKPKLAGTTGKDFTDIVKFGFPVAICYALWGIRNIFFNNIAVKSAGNDAVRALSIMASVTSLPDGINQGITATVMMMVSVFASQKDNYSIRLSIKELIKVGLIITAFRCLFFFLFGSKIAVLFGAVGIQVEMARNALWFNNLNVFLNIVSATLMGMYQTYGRIKYLNIIDVFMCFVIPVGWSYILTPVIGENAIWASYTIAELFVLITFIVTTIVENKNLHVWENMTRLEGVKPGDSICYSVTSCEQAVAVSKEIYSFCVSRQIDEQTSNYCSLCFEEIAVQITERFREGKNNVIYLFADKSESGVTMTVRDNAKGFDVSSMNDIFNPEDPFKNIGIRIVSSIAREMTYRNELGMNVFTIKM